MTNIPKPNDLNPFVSGSQLAAEHDDLKELTPKKIVEYLNRYIIGQDEAKRAVAIALRNRWRRQQLERDVAEEIIPKNILIIGPTGVGKTEIARRISKLTRSPFIKVEASKFTEVGYVGRDVESMIRDLTEIAANMVKAEHRTSVRDRAELLAEDRLLDLLLPPPSTDMSASGNDTDIDPTSEPDSSQQTIYDSNKRTREKFRKKLRDGELDQKIVELEVKENQTGLIEVFSSSGIEEIGMHIKDMLPGVFNQKKKRRKMTIEQARRLLVDEEANRLVDMDRVIQDAIYRVENNGIVFIDEIDKIAGRESSFGPDVSREGVQRDLLPIIEGSTVATKYGLIKTDHILFIGAGAFSVSKPSDLIPELQGRFPVKVDVHSLTQEQMRRILEEPDNAITKQYIALLSTEKVDLVFDANALDAIAALAEEVNHESEDIGARRLHTIMERLLEEISFHASEMPGQSFTVTSQYVRQTVSVDQITRSENIRKKRRPGFKTTENSQ